MIDKKILLTEESIGKTFDLYIGEKHIEEFEIAIKNKNLCFQGYSDTEGFIAHLEFNKYGKELDLKNHHLKQQKEKIDLWEWMEEKFGTYIRYHSSTITICKRDHYMETGSKVIAIIPVKRLAEEKPYFYEGEGL